MDFENEGKAYIRKILQKTKYPTTAQPSLQNNWKFEKFDSLNAVTGIGSGNEFNKLVRRTECMLGS